MDSTHLRDRSFIGDMISTSMRSKGGHFNLGNWASCGAAALILWVATAGGAPAASDPIRLWPGVAPGDSAELAAKAEADTTKPTDNLVGGKRLIRLGNVSSPTITVYPAPKRKNTGTAVLVCPGGAYQILALDLEGTEVCEWLNSLGVTGVLLKYRVPKRPDRERHAAALQDAQRAMGLVRQRASEWGVNPRTIGVLGFSAGGHLAAALSTTSGQRTYPKVDDADALSCRPDFSVLVYPAYLTVKEQHDAVAPELTINSNTPPTFLVIAQDDPVRVENALGYSWALRQARVPFALHVYPSGGHGYGLRRTSENVTTWPDRVTDWLRGLGHLERRRAR